MARDDDSTPETLVGVSFGDAFRAQEFLTAATRLASNGRLRLRDAVFIVKDDEGRTHVRETIDPQPGSTALSGALWAGLFGLLLGGPVGWVAGAAIGAGTGAATAKVVDLGIPDEWVDWFREAVQPGTSTLALLVTELDRDALAAELERFQGAHLVYANLAPDVIGRFREALGEATAEVAPGAPDEPV
jgi:uncharacterized membrane protein